MKNQNTTNELEQQWERAVEQAHEDTARREALSGELLDSAAGLQVKAGVRSGEWTQTYSCNGGCTHGMC